MLIKSRLEAVVIEPSSAASRQVASLVAALIRIMAGDIHLFLAWADIPLFRKILVSRPPQATTASRTPRSGNHRVLCRWWTMTIWSGQCRPLVSIGSRGVTQKQFLVESCHCDTPKSIEPRLSSMMTTMSLVVVATTTASTLFKKQSLLMRAL